MQRKGGTNGYKLQGRKQNNASERQVILKHFGIVDRQDFFPFSRGPVHYFTCTEVVATQAHACHTALKRMVGIYDRRHLTIWKSIVTCLLLVLNDLYEHLQ